MTIATTTSELREGCLCNTIDYKCPHSLSNFFWRCNQAGTFELWKCSPFKYFTETLQRCNDGWTPLRHSQQSYNSNQCPQHC